MTTLLLHGLGTDHRQPLNLVGPVIAAIAPNEPVIAPDIRAHGVSPLIGIPDDFDLDRIAEEVAEQARAVIDAKNESHADGTPAAPSGLPFTIVGISLGAAIALRIAVRGLLPVDRAVFVRPSLDDTMLPDNLRIFPVVGQLLAEAGASGEAELRERTIFRRLAAESPAGAQGVLAQFRAARAAERAIRLIEFPRNRAFSDEAELARVAARGIRSLVLGAPRDPVHPLALAERWAGGLEASFEQVPERDAGREAQDREVRELLGRWLVATAQL